MSINPTNVSIQPQLHFHTIHINFVCCFNGTFPHRIPISIKSFFAFTWCLHHKHWTQQQPSQFPGASHTKPMQWRVLASLSTLVDWNLSSKRASGWPIGFFFISVLNKEGPVKKSPCIKLVAGLCLFIHPRVIEILHLKEPLVGSLAFFFISEQGGAS